MLCYRAYRLYIGNAGLSKIGHQIKANFDTAISRALQEGLLEQANDYKKRDQGSKIVRIKGTEPVLLRAAGNRTFDEIPPTEIAALMQILVQNTPHMTKAPQSQLFRQTLECYGFKRMTKNVQDILDIAWNIIKDEQPSTG